MTMIKCAVCDTVFESQGQITCSDHCHEEFIRYMSWRYGEFKKVVRASTGEAFKVPIADIIECGVKEQDLDRYPKWEDSGECRR
jgi:hypothetical protein